MNNNFINEDVLTLNNIYVRFEPKINSGTVFLFSRQTGDFYEGNSQLYSIIKLIDGYHTVDEICNELVNEYKDDFSEISESLKQILTFLVDKGFAKCL